MLGWRRGDRTPDLLTASQALSQLSYAPVRRSTIRELPRRCKDNFGKSFGGGGEGRNRPRTRARERASEAPRCPFLPAGAPGAAALPPPSSPAPFGTSRVPPTAVFRFRDAGHHPPTAILPAPGPLSGPIAPPPTRRSQNHAGLRGQAGNPEHAAIGKIKPAGRRLANSVK